MLFLKNVFKKGYKLSHFGYQLLFVKQNSVKKGLRMLLVRNVSRWFIAY